MKKVINLTGQKHPRWKVKCEECKEEYEIGKRAFLKNKNQNCNMHNHRFEDLTGQKFGKLIILGRGKDKICPGTKAKTPQWKVKCKDCGIEYELKKISFFKTQKSIL